MTTSLSNILTLPSPLSRLQHPLLESHDLHLSIKRDDLIHPHLQGNKWRKLKYNLQAARAAGHRTLLTFGGAWSNHIHATAAAGHYFGLRSIGIIRGERPPQLSPTLADAQRWGMQLHFIDRQSYREKHRDEFIASLHARFGEFYLIPEGGSNLAGIRGCGEIVDELEDDYDVICVDCGTGATLAGIINGLRGSGQVLGFAVLKGADFIRRDVEQYLQQLGTPTLDNWHINLDYHFGGYARTRPELMHFIQQFKQQHDIQLEPVYSAKMFYGIFDLIERDYFARGSRILALHSGGLQGLRGFQL